MIAAFLSYGSFFLTTAFAYAILCLGLNLQWGKTGLFNVGVAGFVGVGAYVSALLTTPASAAHLGGFGLPWPVGWLAGAAAAALLSLLVGALTLRLRADYLAITTFGFAVAIQLVLLNLQSLTGGPFGIGFIPRPFEGLADRPLLFGLANLAVTAALTLLLYLALQNLARSPWGRVLRAIREDETAALSLGKDAASYRLQAFALGGGLMGLGGAIQAHFIGFIAPNNYLPNLTFQVWTMLIIGGAGSNRGAILGALLVWALWAATGGAITAFVPAELQARAGALQIAAIGLGLCLVLLLRPGGLFGLRRHAARG